MGWKDAPLVENKNTPAWMSAPVVNSVQSQPSPSWFDKTKKYLGEAISQPFRGFRGIGVGTERLLLGDSPTAALEAANRAVTPGYVPAEGEKIGAFAGGVAPLAPLGLPAGIAASMIGSGSEKLAETSSLGDASNEAAKAGALGMLTAGAIKGGAYTIGKGMEYGGKLLSPAYRAFISSIKGVGRNVVDTVMETADDMTPKTEKVAQEFFDAIGGIKEKANLKLSRAQNLPVTGATPEVIANKGIELSKSLRGEVGTLSEKANELLSTEKTIPKTEILGKIQKLIDSLKTSGTTFGKLRGQAESSLKKWADDIDMLGKVDGIDKPGPKFLSGPYGEKISLPAEPTAPDVSSGKISEFELKQIIKAIDGDTIWDGPASEPIVRVLRSLRGEMDDVLKQNTSYSEAMVPIAKKIRAAESIEDALGLARGSNNVVNVTDQTASKIKSIIAGNKVSSEDDISQVGFKDLINSARKRMEMGDFKDSAIKEAAKALRARYPSDINIYQMAETAARQGEGSPPYLKLERTMQDILGKEKGSDVARSVLTSQAKELFLRKTGSVFTGGTLKGLTGSYLGDRDLKTLVNIDKAFKVLQAKGSEISKTNPHNVKGIAGMLESYRRTQEAKK